MAGHTLAFMFLAIASLPMGCNYACNSESSKLWAFFAILSFIMMRLSMIDRAWRRKHGEN